MDKNLQEAFLSLVRLGIDVNSSFPSKAVEWTAMKALAERQGLSAIVLDGIERMSECQQPPQLMLLTWIGQVMLEEERYAKQWDASCEMARLFASNGIRTYVLKGMVVSECYPKPQHRVSSDVDCFLLPDEGDADVWENGNRLMEAAGYKVERGFYKNSSFHMSGLTVENHRYMVPFRGNRRLKNLERWLQAQFKNGSRGLSGSRIEGTELWRPPVMVSALFSIEHAYSHFLHEGLTWRHILDWMMFRSKHKEEINWQEFKSLIDEYGFRKFYDSYYRLGKYLVGEIPDSSLTIQDKRMLADVWAELDLHETVRGVKGKLALVGNTWRARWKYHYFSEDSMLKALWIQVYGFLFVKNPTLD